MSDQQPDTAMQKAIDVAAVWAKFDSLAQGAYQNALDRGTESELIETEQEEHIVRDFIAACVSQSDELVMLRTWRDRAMGVLQAVAQMAIVEERGYSLSADERETDHAWYSTLIDEAQALLTMAPDPARRS